MSLTNDRHGVNLCPPLSCERKKTNVKEMQKTFESYTNQLPHTADACYMLNGSRTLAVIGSTGFLGPYIIASLLSIHKHSEILCLNRSPDGQQRTESALSTLTTDAQLRFWVTDITQSKLGLTALQVAFLASRVDELIFNAWDPHWGKDLAYFNSFLSGIRNAIDLCAAGSRRPRIIFVSSICAVGNWPLINPTDPTIPEAVVWDSRCAMPHGYGESKCVAEQILAKAHEVSGVPPLDWIPVDILAEGIANITMRPPNGLGVDVFNALHPNAAQWALLYQTLQTRFGLSSTEESLPEWLDRFDPTYMKLHGFLSAAGNGREHNMTFKNQKALEVLPLVPEITEDLLARWLTDWSLTADVLSAKL
ncbi:NAD(P)-binding protein [Ophiobolus disseminans]|uniref:NAD(P)-binding protein n=1 Tax=Ophiobolus disseminans TaxID=1469910 RepID=A0A6A6ZD54_9PLEO|nr:NAD(P)-binding protein [Ophiobolus disseminans]